MKTKIEINNKSYEVDLSQGIDLSLPLAPDGPRAWYVDAMRIEPVEGEGFIGEVARGGSVNFRNVFFNPHGHGTHTENVGHLLVTDFPVYKSLVHSHFLAQILSVELVHHEEDWIIAVDSLNEKIHSDAQALILRTLPNETDKLHKIYSGTNFPYVSVEAMRVIAASGVKHLLIDLPSVDREEDGGALAAHRVFWNVPSNPDFYKTITEFVFVPNEVSDGMYLLNLQVTSLVNDASPSRPVVFALAHS